MAQARLEKFGTIYTRVLSLLRGGAIEEAERPLWFVIYEAFPPKYEPRYDRVLPKVNIRNIYYEEDIIRARFHKDYTKLEAVNLLEHTNCPSQTQKFLDEYNKLLKLDVSKNAAYEQALETFTSSLDKHQDQKQVKVEQNSDI